MNEDPSLMTKAKTKLYPEHVRALSTVGTLTGYQHLLGATLNQL
jgi:hypothetical protein